MKIKWIKLKKDFTYLLFSLYSFSLQQCEDIYGKQFNLTTLKQGIEQTNTNYGGKMLKATKVMYPNGSIDPWHALGILADLSTEQIAVYINGKK